MSAARQWTFTVEQLMKRGYSRKDAEKEADKVLQAYKYMESKNAFSSATASKEAFEDYTKRVKEGYIEDTGMTEGLTVENGIIQITDVDKKKEEEIWGKPLEPKIKIPSLPSLPSLPAITAEIKRSAQVTALFVIAVVLIIIYMLTGKGKKGLTVVT